MIDPNKPPLKVTEHDMLQVKMVEHLSAALGMALAFAAVHAHASYRNGLIRTARKLAQLIDTQEWEAEDLRAWWQHERQAQWVERMVAKINANDIAGVQRLAYQMQYEHPMPRLFVG